MSKTKMMVAMQLARKMVPSLLRMFAGRIWWLDTIPRNAEAMTSSRIESEDPDARVTR